MRGEVIEFARATKREHKTKSVVKIDMKDAYPKAAKQAQKIGLVASMEDA
jgi:hypothetical protein